MSVRRIAVALFTTAVLLVPAAMPAGASASSSIVPTIRPYPAAGTKSIGPGTASGNTNAQLAEVVPATVVPGWAATPELCPSSGGVSVTSIAVSGSRTVVLERQYQCGSVSAYDTASGALQWRVPYHLATSAWVSHTNRLVYVTHDEPATSSSHLVSALDLATGTVRWSSPLLGGDIDSIGNGVLVGDTTMLDLATGSSVPRLKIPAGTSGGKSLVADGRVFRNSSTDVTAWSVKTGALLWSYKKVGTSAGGDALPAFHEGRLYVRSDYDSSTVKVFSAASGKVLRQLPVSTSPIAFDGDYGFLTASKQNATSTVTAVDLRTGHRFWTRGLPDDPRPSVEIGSGPVVANGLLWLLHAPDTGTHPVLTAFDEVTGATRSTTTLPCAAGVDGALTVAQKRLFASSECGVQTYVGPR